MARRSSGATLSSSGDKHNKMAGVEAEDSRGVLEDDAGVPSLNQLMGKPVQS
jgi:hypothetical protein